MTETRASHLLDKAVHRVVVGPFMSIAGRVADAAVVQEPENCDFKILSLKGNLSSERWATLHADPNWRG